MGRRMRECDETLKGSVRDPGLVPNTKVHELALVKMMTE
mgnify:CR=1 FL=1